LTLRKGRSAAGIDVVDRLATALGVQASDLLAHPSNTHHKKTAAARGER
jgi:hypothetical protein